MTVAGTPLARRRVPWLDAAPWTASARTPGRRRPWPTNRSTGAGLAVVGLVVLNLVVSTGTAGFLRAVVGLPVALVLPGALALRALGGSGRRGWEWLLHAVAFSLVGLMAVGLLLSAVPGGGLTPIGCLVGLDLLVAALASTTHIIGRGWPDRLPETVAHHRPEPGTGRIAAAATVVLGSAGVALAVAGARQLNGGHGPALTEAGLGSAAAALAGAVVAARRRRNGAAATGVYLVAATVLFAISLRGVGVTGHDIKIEYRVLLDTLQYRAWRPGGPDAGYTSCLSLTVLPTFLARLLGVAALDVFRVCFQLIFAMVPVGVFLIACRLVEPGYAVLCGGLFIAFPTFVNDMSMTNRQEIAFVFFTVALLALVGVRTARWRRTTLFTVAAVGLTVSHYSSTYVTAALLVLAWILRRLRLRLGPGWALRPRSPVGATSRTVLALGTATATVTAMAVTWAVFTGSALELSGNLHRAVAAVATHASVLSGGTAYSPVASETAIDDTARLREYANVLRHDRAGQEAAPAPPGCTARVAPPDLLPLTALGTAMANDGVAPGPFNAAVRGILVVLYEVGAAAGTVMLWWRARTAREEPRPADRVMVELSGAAMGLLVVSVVAPQVTDSYGILRLYQQLLVVLAPCVILMLSSLLRPLTTPVADRTRARAIEGALAATVVVGCLVATSGLLPRLTGGYVPQLNLANAGPHYRAYYAGPDDISTAAWVRAHLESSTWIVADSRDFVNLRAMAGLLPDEGLLPGTVPDDAYLDVTTPDGRDAVGVAVVGDSVIRYTFPLRCVDAGRPVLYAGSAHRIYGPRRR